MDATHTRRRMDGERMTAPIEYEFRESGRREFLVNEVWQFTVATSSLGTSVSSPSIAIASTAGTVVTATWCAAGASISGANAVATVSMLAAGTYTWTLTVTADGNTKKFRGTFEVHA
jgi:hypothetical protein